MESFNGKVESVSTKDGETNGRTWKRVTYTINGDKFSRFENPDEDNADFGVGDKVNGTFETNGNYKNVKTMNMVLENTDGPISAPVEVVKNNSLSVKIFKFTELADMETALNEFGRTHKVKATQNQFHTIGDNNTTVVEWKEVFVAWVFYEN